MPAEILIKPLGPLFIPIQHVPPLQLNTPELVRVVPIKVPVPIPKIPFALTTTLVIARVCDELVSVCVPAGPPNMRLIPYALVSTVTV
jgi:hypothetical protein